MNYDRIDILDRGTVWQGGTPDAGIDQPPFEGPLLIVCMDRGEANEQWIEHKIVEGVTAVWIDDVPTGCLADNVLKAYATMFTSWLENEGNLYLHCAAGISRASYIDIAVHCVAMTTVAGAPSALSMLELIREHRPIADPNPGFLAQLERLWP